MTPAAYWNQGIEMVPAMTGAATLMDGADILEHAERLDIPLPFDAVMDVGCGTGRLGQFAIVYVGFDVAADAVAYCRRAGRHAHLIAGPSSMPVEPLTGGPGDWVTCLSVFTHIARTERQAYLQAFLPLAEQLLVDIIPGDGSGDVALWTAVPADFEADLAAAGWQIEASYDRACPAGPVHRYYRCRRAAYGASHP
ncbi:MAG: hypothetical protein AB7R67_21755 [Vicinamibacterales bacterium]